MRSAAPPAAAKSHLVKGIERVFELNRVISSGQLGESDKMIAEGLRSDLLKSLEPLTAKLNLPLTEVLKGLLDGSISISK